ncbi:MAG: glucosamine-6-phosphate deaminase [Chitinophagaceae bacterium]|nr:glucosamine-6-phosphate deaminase [Chitinophagaceae bacterium]
MKLTIEKDYDGMSLRAARQVIDLVKSNPDALICIAAGDTPKLTCELIANLAKKENVAFNKCYFVSLDEWVGIPPENEGSCQYFLRTWLFKPLKISDDQVHLFNAMSKDLEKECAGMDKIIREKGGIDLIIVGVGRNGHIGFNEPGIRFEEYSHVVDLDETTQSVGQKYFREETKLTQGITLGLQHLMEAKKAILIANGIKKADVMKETIEGEIHTGMPASIMRKHTNAEIIIDEEAASKLTSAHEIQ